MNRVQRFSLKERFSLKYTNRIVKHPLKLMIWSCFSAKSVGRIAVISGSMNSSKYIETLETYLLPSINDMNLENPSFVDDSAPCHRSKIVNEWKNCWEIQQIEWPGNSPDLNPIENLWSLLKRKLRKITNPNKEILLKNIHKIWKTEINQSILSNLAESMPNRIKKVLLAKGDTTKY